MVVAVRWLRCGRVGGFRLMIVVLSGVGDHVASRGLGSQRHASGGPTLWGIINPPRTLRSVFWSPSLGSPVTPAPKGTRPAQRYQAGSLCVWSRNARLDTAGPARLATPAGVTGDPRHHFCVEVTGATLHLPVKAKSRSLAKTGPLGRFFVQA